MLGTNILITTPENNTQPVVMFQEEQAKIWHRMLLNVICQNFMLSFDMNDTQLSNEAIYSNDFVLHAMCFYLSANARLVQ
jgi:hypothetical protein